uniref:Uncharacterized protein n=1 Tax=Cacopsylla melanoneura TaxID=428564 RepID=A0A8D8TI85_9HEMI
MYNFIYVDYRVRCGEFAGRVLCDRAFMHLKPNGRLWISYRHATADEIRTSMKHCRKGWHEYTGYKGPLYRDPTDTLSVRKAYKAVPGLNSDKKQLKLERKLEILKYKINHEIATDQDIILYCAIMRGRVTRSMLSSEPVSVEEEEEPSG